MQWQTRSEHRSGDPLLGEGVIFAIPGKIVILEAGHRLGDNDPRGELEMWGLNGFVAMID